MSPRVARTLKDLRRAAAVLLALLLPACAQTSRGSGAAPSASAATRLPQGMMVRISEIRIDPDRLGEYAAILKEEAEASVRLEPGVVSILPMYERERPTEVRILEIYATRAAYESHLRTPHFQKYKTTTLPMVTSLRLVDMEPMDPATMTAIFAKMRAGR